MVKPGDTQTYAHHPPLVVPFSRPAVVFLPLCLRFSARSRGYFGANVPLVESLLGGVLSRNGLKQRRDSVSYPSIHPRQIRDKCNEVFYAGQDGEKMSNKRSTTHVVHLHCSSALAPPVLRCKGNASHCVDVLGCEGFAYQQKRVGGE